MYDKKNLQVWRHMLFNPLPLSQTVTPSRTPSPSSVTYFMDGPFGTGSGPRGCGPRGGAGVRAHEAEISFQISALAGVWTSDFDCGNTLHTSIAVILAWGWRIISCMKIGLALR